MRLKQPSRLKYRSSKITKYLTIKSLLEIGAVFLISFALGMLIGKIFASKLVSIISWIALLCLGSLLLIPNRKNNCKMYVLIWRMFLFWTMPKKYQKEDQNKKVRNSQDLNPYSCLINEFVIENKLDKQRGIHNVNYFANYLRVFKINGINIWRESELAQEIFIENFANALSDIKDKISFVKLDEILDYNANIEYIQKYANDKEHFKEYNQENIKAFKNANSNALFSCYYLIINGTSETNLENNTSNILEKFGDINIGLEPIGGVNLLKVLKNINMFDTDDIAIDEYWKNIDNEYNKENSLDKLFNYSKINLRKNHLEINDELVQILCLNRLPYELSSEWIKNLFQIEGTIVWNNYPISFEGANKILDKSYNVSIDDKEVAGSISENFKGSIEELATVEAICQINYENYKLFDTNMFFVIKAKNKNDLTTSLRRAKNIASRKNITLNELYYRQLNALAEISNLYFQRLEREYYQITSINLALGWPFESVFHNDNNNLLLAKTESENKIPIAFNLFKLDDTSRTNFNLFINGSSGKGKTTLLKKMITSIVNKKNKVILIDPKAEYLTLAKKLKGQIVDFGSGINTTINPLQIRKQISLEEQNNVVVVGNHITWLENFFKVFLDIDNNTWILLEHILERFYDHFNFYTNNIDFDNLKNTDYPTLKDLVKYLDTFDASKLYDVNSKDKIIQSIKEKLQFKLSITSKFNLLFNGHTNIEINNDFVVFNTQQLSTNSEDIYSKLGTYCLLSLISEQININHNNNVIKEKEYCLAKGINKISATDKEVVDTFLAVVIDELHRYIAGNNDFLMKYITDWYKTARGFECGVIGNTQNPSDLLASKYSTKIIQNSQYAMFLGLDSDDIEDTKELFKNSNKLLDTEVDFLSKAKKGQLIIKINSQKRIKACAYYTELEKDLFFDYLTNENA